jgi:hypothetical protein
VLGEFRDCYWDEDAEASAQTGDPLDTPEYPDELPLRQYWALATAPIRDIALKEIAELELFPVNDLALPRTVADLEAQVDWSAEVLEQEASWIDDLWCVEQALRPRRPMERDAPDGACINRADYD